MNRIFFFLSLSLNRSVVVKNHTSSLRHFTAVQPSCHRVFFYVRSFYLKITENVHSDCFNVHSDCCLWTFNNLFSTFKCICWNVETRKIYGKKATAYSRCVTLSLSPFTPLVIRTDWIIGKQTHRTLINLTLNSKNTAYIVILIYINSKTYCE